MSPTQNLLSEIKRILQNQLPAKLSSYNLPNVKKIVIGHPPISAGTFEQSPLISLEPAESRVETSTVGGQNVGTRRRTITVDIWIWLLANDDETMTMLSAGFVDAIDEVLSANPQLNNSCQYSETKELSYSPRIETESGLAQIVALRLHAFIRYRR